MEWNVFSFFLNIEEAFIKLNPNILETNLINILILIGLLVYAYNSSFTISLQTRTEEIKQTIQNAQKDVVNASNYYLLAEKGFTQSLFWLYSWKRIYEQDKINFVKTKYKFVQSGLLETFQTTEILIKNFENKTFFAIQNYLIFATTGILIKKFLVSSERNQSVLLEFLINKLGEVNKND
jgi:hypothetical protein